LIVFFCDEFRDYKGDSGVQMMNSDAFTRTSFTFVLQYKLSACFYLVVKI